MRKLIIISSLLLTLNSYASAEIAYIVNLECPIDSISSKELEYVFLSKKKYIQNGQLVKPAELSSAELKNRFYQKIAGKNETELRRYWATMIFSGYGHPPKQFHRADKLIHYVQENFCAIAYIDKDAINDAVKLLTLIE